MPIEHLEENVKLPFDRAAIESGDPLRLAAYLYELVKLLETLVLKDIHTTLNWMLDMNPGDWWYSDLPDADGVFAEGTWRFGRNGDGMEMQKLISGTWTKRSRTT